MRQDKKCGVKTMSDYVIGRNPVLELLKKGGAVHKILISKGPVKGSVLEIIAKAKDSKIPVQEMDKKQLDFLISDTNHQWVVALVPAREYVSVDDILLRARDKGEDPFILILDEIEDPHNLGAIIRTADAVGVHGVIIPKHRAVGLTHTVSKVSAGAIEYVPVARVTNLVQTVENLKKEGCWVVAADMQGETMWRNNNLTGPLVCVVGSEGQGISRLLKEKCDFLVRVPMKGSVSSLNASVAAAVLCYEILRQKENK
jgi:23S rRNA (guanosine2251-2'-O)-methyltransferase